MNYFDEWDYKKYFDEKEDVKQYSKTLKDLLEYYNDIEIKSANRYGKKNEDKDKKDKPKSYDEIISKIESMDKESVKDNEKLRNMFWLVKGTAYLRKGQELATDFQNTEECYKKAITLFHRGYKIGEYNLINMLFLLNMGKYFRNLGTNGRRSDYERALDCFEDLEKSLKEHTEDKDTLELWEIRLLLKSQISIGKIKRYLYKMEEAKKDLWSVFDFLFEQIKKSKKTNTDDIEYHNAITRLKSDELLAKECKDFSKNYLFAIQEKFRNEEYIYKNYLFQVLVELGMVYQKERYFDAAKNLFLMVYDLDKGNVDVKNNIGVYLRKQGELEKALHIFSFLEKKGNRFAKINALKCWIELDENYKENNIENESDSEIRDILIRCGNLKTKPREKVIEEELKGYIKTNPADLELCLLLGLYYKKKERWEEAQEIFRDIYTKTSYIRKGTIGLKAYYNIVLDLIRKGKFYQAENELERIISECEKGNSTKEEKEKSVEFLSEIELGGCLFHIGQYKDAITKYEEILDMYSKKKQIDCRYKMKEKDLTRIYINLGECYFRLEEIEKAQENFEKGIEKGAANKELNYYIGKCYREKYQMDERVEDLLSAEKNFSQALENVTDDVRINSSWILTQIAILTLKCVAIGEEKRSEVEQNIIKSLKYSNKTYSLKACLEIAKYIKKIEMEDKDALYRAFARITMEEEEEGYQAFEYFRKKEPVRRLESVFKGKLLIKLFEIYENVLKVKKKCRYTNKDVVSCGIPVHYTKIKTLKILLEKRDNPIPKLRLWNTIYMNDSSEGEVFIELLQGATGEGDISKKQEILSKYFRYLDNSEANMVPVNGNVYITSFSMSQDSIPMWYAYGDDACGCSITFEDDYFDIRNEDYMERETSSYSDSDYPLYKVHYLDVNNEREEDQEYKAYLKEIWNLLEIVENMLSKEREEKTDLREKKAWEEAENIIREFIVDCLNEIRFLFKDKEYDYEKEVRLIQYSHKPEIDSGNFAIPRLYTEVNKEIKMKKVCLGRKINTYDVNQLVSWLNETKKVKSISISSRHYQ